MPSTPYDLVRDDQDLRIPLHAEQAFFNGIPFQAKVSHTHIHSLLALSAKITFQNDSRWLM